MLVGARALQGAFGALLAPAALSLLTTTFTEPAERGKAFGIYAAIAGMGGAIGLLLGGALTETLGWRWCLYVSIFFAVPAAIAGARLLEHTPVRVAPAARRPGRAAGLERPVRARLRPGARASPTAGATPSRSPSWPPARSCWWRSWPSSGASRRRCCRCAWSPTATAARRFLAIGTVSAGLFALFLFLTFYLQNAKGFSAFETGLAFLPLSFSIAPTVAIVSTRVLARTGPRPLVPAGLLIAALGMVLLTRIGVDTAVRDARAAVAGADRDRLRPRRSRPSFATATHGVPPRDAGVASAMVNTSQQVGGSIGTALLSTVGGVGGRLHGRVLVGRGALRRRRAGQRHAAARGHAARAGPRRARGGVNVTLSRGSPVNRV